MGRTTVRLATQVDELLPLARFGEDRVAPRDKALAVRRRKQQLHLGLDLEQLDDSDLGIEVDEQAHRLAEAARAGSLSPASV